MASEEDFNKVSMLISINNCIDFISKLDIFHFK